MKNKFSKEQSDRLIQNLNEIRRYNSGQVFIDKLPTLFRAIRLEIKKIQPQEVNSKSHSDFGESNFLYAVLYSKTVNKTKKNLKKALNEQREIKEKKITFYLGEPHATIVYRNPTIQTFFEFSLFYSWVKNRELSASKAKILFIKFCRSSLGMPLDKEKVTHIFSDFLQFMQGNTSYFDRTALPNDERGRKQKNTTPTILELIKKGRNNSQIASIMLDGKLSDLEKGFSSEGLSETHSKKFAEKEYKILHSEEMKRIASTRRKYSPISKTEKKR